MVLLAAACGEGRGVAKSAAALVLSDVVKVPLCMCQEIVSVAFLTTMSISGRTCGLFPPPQK